MQNMPKLIIGEMKWLGKVLFLKQYYIICLTLTLPLNLKLTIYIIIEIKKINCNKFKNCK